MCGSGWLVQKVLTAYFAVQISKLNFIGNAKYKKDDTENKCITEKCHVFLRKLAQFLLIILTSTSKS